MSKITFFPSQIGSQKVTPHSYTSSPLALLRHDIYLALQSIAFLPFIVFPLSPTSSGDLCELSITSPNMWSMFLHLLLVLLQLPFILSIPFWIVFPIPLSWILGGVIVFWLVNQGICRILNGSQMEFASDPKYTEGKKEHPHEQWILLNGVAVGKHWMKSNVNRLALTFGRPVLGVHNKTNGILFDVIQCLIQRNFNYATQDIRDCYVIVKRKLYDDKLTKVVFILHSQGGIEGGMILDWLLQEVPQDLLAKLEVYTFGNAANHFNNPHLHLISQHAALSSPTTISSTQITTQVHYHKPSTPSTPHEPESAMPMTTKNSRQRSNAGKTLRYIEHYAHRSDFVAQWGVLHFVNNFSLDCNFPRYMGRVFERAGEGHQLNQHYLDSMFPLRPSAKKNGGIGGTGFEGCAEACDFMDCVIELGKNHDEVRDELEGLEMSYLGAQGVDDEEVTLRDMSPISPRMTRLALTTEFTNGRGMTSRRTEYRVRDLSRLWLYRNGGSPKTDEVDLGIARMSTI